MKSVILIAAVAALLTGGGESRAESAQGILDAAWNAQTERWKGLDSYLVVQSTMGVTTRQYLVRTELVDAAGNARTLFMPAPDAGIKSGCVEPYSDGGESGGGDTSAEYLTWFLSSAELIGQESVDGKAAWQLRASNLDRTEAFSEREVEIDSMTMWISKDGYLPLKMRMAGTATVEGRPRPVTIDMRAGDFRKVSGSQLVEPYRRAVSISGIAAAAGIDAEQMAEAKRAMADFEKQLASMPESQREMMKSMMGPRIEQMRKMTESGSFDSEIVVESITPNPEAFGERIVACEAG